MSKPRKTTKVQFYVTNEFYADLQQQANQREMSIPTLVKLALADWRKNNEVKHGNAC